MTPPPEGGRGGAGRTGRSDWRPMGVSLFFGAVALAWLVLAASTLRAVRALKELPQRAEAGAGPPPRVSVVVAARNEEARIETTVRRLLTQDGVELEVIAVDDRSTDRTG